MSTPGRSLSPADVALLTIGIVVGAGIFRVPAEIAAAAPDSLAVLALWAIGGLAALAGALSYAELSSRFPSIGGEYHFLRLAWGARLSALFIWARVAVMQTGAIATVAFVAGDHVAAIWPAGPAPAVWAGLSVLLVTAANLAGLSVGRAGQRVMVVAVLASLALVILSAFLVPQASVAATGDAPRGFGIGLAMVFVMLAYGGWNEAAYLSAEVKGGQNAIVRAILGGLVLVILIYLGVNAALLWSFGREGLAATPAPAAALVAAAFGPAIGAALGGAVILASLSTMNATVITGARAMCALGQDMGGTTGRAFPGLAAIGRWDAVRSVPRAALLVQGAVALALVGYGATARDGFAAMVAFGAPPFWLFLSLTALAIFRLRRTHPDQPGFSVPLYPLVPLIFLAASLAMLWSALGHAAFMLGASEEGELAGVLGLAILLAGVPLVWRAR
ncbi:APC family permease [Sandaracinobacteroides sp. A072]|uniref:APC family permease n=1 Tax=Sandaracinobacteroides sp. A072 TaxID=3461146 RepID=UPI0040416601